MGIAGGYYDGPLAYQLQIKFLIPDVRSEHDKNFYENAWKVHKEQEPEARKMVGREARMQSQIDHLNSLCSTRFAPVRDVIVPPRRKGGIQLLAVAASCMR